MPRKPTDYTNVTSKICTQCKQEKPLNDFFRRRVNGRETYRSNCKECSTTAARQWMQDHPEMVRHRGKQRSAKYHRNHLSIGYWARMGLNFTEEDFFAMWDAQVHKCALCGEKPSLFLKKRFPLDHDHETGKVRAIICHRCNLIVGLVEHEPDLVEKALRYIAKHKKQESAA